jgi:hypothetical protein
MFLVLNKTPRPFTVSEITNYVVPFVKRRLEPCENPLPMGSLEVYLTVH